MHYYQFNIGDYASHTRHLSLIEDIAYRRLLDLYYLHERPLNICLTSVARQINMRDYESEVGLVLQEFFQPTDDGWINQRADKEIAHFRAKIEQASRAGKASAERRLNERSTDVQPTNNHKPITNNQIDITPKPPRGAISLEQYLEQCKSDNKKPIPEDHAVFDYAKEIGLPHDFLRLQWLEFKDRYTAPGAKKYKLWSTVFAKSVRDNWFRLWALKDDKYVLTTTGLQAQKLHKVAA